MFFLARRAASTSGAPSVRLCAKDESASNGQLRLIADSWGAGGQLGRSVQSRHEPDSHSQNPPPCQLDAYALWMKIHLVGRGRGLLRISMPACRPAARVRIKYLPIIETANCHETEFFPM